MAITTSSSISVNALEDERLVFTPRNWVRRMLPAWPSARNIKVVPCSQCSVLGSGFSVGKRVFADLLLTAKNAEAQKSRRVKRGMMLPSASSSNFEIPCSVFDILSLHSRCTDSRASIATALHIKKRPGTWPGLWCVFSFWLINQITLRRRVRTAAPGRLGSSAGWAHPHSTTDHSLSPQTVTCLQR